MIEPLDPEPTTNAKMPFRQAVASACVVLVVEDDAIVRIVAAEMLRDAGLEVIEAPSADVAWGVLEDSRRIDVLFTDIDMPGSMDGLALAGRVAQRWPHIRLVVTSGRVAPRDGSIPADGLYLSKPYVQRQLVRAVSKPA